jgi:hypothetical protein
MDIDRLLKLAAEYLSDYFASFVATLQKPELRFQPVPEAGANPSDATLITPSGAPGRGARLDPRLFSFTLLSVFIGSTINALIPGGRPSSPDFPTTATVVLFTWFFYSIVIHATTRLVNGHGTFWETLSVSFQVFSVLYVLSSFAAFLWSALVRIQPVRFVLLSLHWPPVEAFANEPALAYFVIQFIFLAVYLPLSMKHVHRLNRIEQILIGLFALVIVLIGYTLFPVFGFMLQAQ